MLKCYVHIKKIVSFDFKQYGPSEEPNLRGWINELHLYCVKKNLYSHFGRFNMRNPAQPYSVLLISSHTDCLRILLYTSVIH